MSSRIRKSAFRWFLACCACAIAMMTMRVASAEETIIKRPGAHPNYSVEIEPHLLAGFLLSRAGQGVGVGARFTIPVVKNGFIGSINNSVGIGFGIDWIHWGGCYRYYYFDPQFGYACPDFNTFVFPVVMQWNFFLSKHWSVFGEPGLAIAFNSYGTCVDFVDNRGNLVACGNRPSTVGVNPFVLFVGGRYHFSETTALTMRLGWPYWSIGVSFMP